jgi:hypothetical protein
LIGIVSYLLIGYFFTRIQATKAALLALTMNRLGDMGLSIGFFALFALLGTIDYSAVFSVAPYLNENAITIISLLLFSGAMAKSAQVPLSTWLPGSMEAGSTHNLIRLSIKFLLLIKLICYSLLVCLVTKEFSGASYFINDFSFEQATQIYNLFNFSIIIYKDRDAKGNFIISPPRARDRQGRFISVADNKPVKPLTSNVLEGLVGSLLGDGSLRVNKKDSTGKLKLNTNCNYVVTLKSKEYIYFLWNLFSSLRTDTKPCPWPNPNKGLAKPAILQYHFSTRYLPVLTEMFKIWYKWDENTKKYVKKVPLNISNLLTERGLAIWIMDDGFKVGNGVGLATECFTEKEIDLLKSVLENKFGFLVTKNIRKTSTGKISFRLFISAKSKDKLFSLVLPYFIPEMLYKLNIKN